MPQESGDIREELEQITRAPQKQKKRTVCVIGHKNPDTDSICAAISYTYLKKQLEKPDGGYQYVACRAGSVSAETQFVLDYFHVPQPLFIENIGTRVKDLEIRRTPGVDAKISVKDAWNLMNTQNVFTLPITDAESHLQGLITINDIAKSYMDENDSAIVSVARTPYRNIMETLDAEMVVGDPEASFTEGKVVIAAANPDVMENYINPHDMVILGNRYESQLMSILAGGLKDHPAHGEGEGNDDPGHSARHVYGCQTDQPIDANRFLYEVGQSDYVSSGRLYRPDQGDHVEEEVPRFPGS